MITLLDRSLNVFVVKSVFDIDGTLMKNCCKDGSDSYNFCIFISFTTFFCYFTIEESEKVSGKDFISLLLRHIMEEIIFL